MNGWAAGRLEVSSVIKSEFKQIEAKKDKKPAEKSAGFCLSNIKSLFFGNAGHNEQKTLSLKIGTSPNNIELDKNKIYGSMVAWLAGKRLGGMTRPLGEGQ